MFKVMRFYLELTIEIIRLLGLMYRNAPTNL